MTYRLTDVTSRRLTRIAAEAQRESRTPALAAGVAHRGRRLWDAAVGTADLSDASVALGADTQFPVASNTKTFVAVLVMALRDAGRLSLEDRIAAHLPDAGHGDITIRQLLAHASGIQREPVGDVWDTLEPPEPTRLVENWSEAERVLGPHDRWHYSNLGYMLLGEIVSRVEGRPWEESLRIRLLEPLELRRTTLAPSPPCAGRYYVPPFTDVPIEEPLVLTGSMSAAGGLSSTVDDLVRWHAFLLDPDDAILDPDTLEEMRQPQIVTGDEWTQAWGLGLKLVHRDGRVWFGHTGGAPGAITAAVSHAESGMTSVVLMNNSIARDPDGLAVTLGSHVLEHDPPPVDPWVPGSEIPDALAPLTGLWYSEGSPFLFSVRRGRLEARGAQDPASSSPAVFAPESEDVYRTVSGRERGERLVVHRHPDGSVARMHWATYPFTREPLGFGERGEPGG